LTEVLARTGTSSAAEIRAALLLEVERWLYQQDDDFSVLVVKRR
jgi:hypothetical protein